MWEPDDYLDALYKKTMESHAYDFGKEKDRIRLKEKLAYSLGRFPVNNKEFNEETISESETAEYYREQIVIKSVDGLVMPMYILTPKQKKKEYPAVLALHGHGYGSGEVVGLSLDGSEAEGSVGIHHHFGIELVRRGMKVIAPELVGFGDRRLIEDKKKEKANSCYRLAVNLLMHGKTLAGLRVHEAIRALDYIGELKDVEQDRLGIMGFSGGGLIAALTAILDNRIHATVLSGFTNTFRESILASDHCLDNYIPGLLTIAELPELIGLIHPRALFIETGTNDGCFPITGARSAIDRISHIYNSTSTGGSFGYDIFEGGHEVNGRMALDWLKNQLIIGGEKS
ncbi:hypothetical protein GCM10007216_13200 [Thalassobacillus devorans]|uniref:Dienelactone hydrolase n=1 Tax=Thalassobacillus devorans TaxID=279813 RepID=A0ABQ1NZN7_9BACI|nr:alpha/beta hydrolase family protein [Thalassobacillus devorans]NIK28739.1 dienelactone hydrolase [Thalassobacillus devorans]GGC83936.1 hypothetical protein GCM10007216_13200 [Thalassobacillus devorans]